MTKRAELETLRRVAEELGPHSYCGPWLLSILPEVEADMRSDTPPTPTLRQAKGIAAETIRAAMEEGDKIIAAAKENEAAINERAAETRDELLTAIRRAEKLVCGW